MARVEVVGAALSAGTIAFAPRRYSTPEWLSRPAARGPGQPQSADKAKHLAKKRECNRVAVQAQDIPAEMLEPSEA